MTAGDQISGERTLAGAEVEDLGTGPGQQPGHGRSRVMGAGGSHAPTVRGGAGRTLRRVVGQRAGDNVLWDNVLGDPPAGGSPRAPHAR
ncbi:hypothetical protein SDC9_131951 [bioreactor metagenome]|uniref:Uncharacterized protein n=1 Tax=bioreactor metagenome TaxID=1076179 RepID=A0A645D6P7_9ZZZZ